MSKIKNPVKCGRCLVDMETLYFNDGRAKFIRCPRCLKLYVDKKEEDSDD